MRGLYFLQYTHGMKLPLHIHIGAVICLGSSGWACIQLTDTFLEAVVWWVVVWAPIVWMTWRKMRKGEEPFKW